MITFWVSPGSEWLPAGSRCCHLNRNLFLMTKFLFPTQEHDHFWVSDLHTWIRMAVSRIQQLQGVQKFIFDVKFGIPTQKHKI